MPQSFLLQFQEPCEVEAVKDQSKSIRTETKVEREGSREQADDAVYALPVIHKSTHTRVEKEGTDRSENTYGIEASVAVLPNARGTKTITEVNRESNGVDVANGQTIKAIPSTVVSRHKSTMTVTAIRAETDDQDDERKEVFHMIRPCS